MKKTTVDRYNESRKKSINEAGGIEDLLKLMVDGKKPRERRKLNPTQLAFIQDKSFYRFYMGPAGCAKTVSGLAACFLRAIMEPGSSVLVARLDYNDLKGTTLKSAEMMLENLPAGTLLGRTRSAPEEWTIQPLPFRTAEGKWIDTPSKILFSNLKEDFGGYFFNHIFLDEVDEAEESAVLNLTHRMRCKGAHYPFELDDEVDAGIQVSPEDPRLEGYYSVTGALNPPPKTHWFYRAATGLDEKDEPVEGQKKWAKMFRPEPRENTRNLPIGYYEKMEHLPLDMRMRYRDGEFGSVFPGSPVIREFQRNIHASSNLSYVPGATMYRFWDFGYNHPCCLWSIVTKTGQVRVLYEFLGHKMEGTSFVREVKRLTAKHFPEAENFIDIGDPAVKQQKDTGRMINILYQEGILLRCKKRPIDLGIGLLRRRFKMLEDDGPAILIDKKNCQIFISGLAGGYHMDDKGKEIVKDGYYDHEVDAFRYGMTDLFLGNETGNKKRTIRSSIEYKREEDLY